MILLLMLLMMLLMMMLLMLLLMQVIFFAKDANLQMLSKAAQYVLKNESGLWLVVVHFFDDEQSPMLQELANNISVLVKCVRTCQH